MYRWENGKTPITKMVELAVEAAIKKMDNGKMKKISNHKTYPSNTTVFFTDGSWQELSHDAYAGYYCTQDEFVADLAADLGVDDLDDLDEVATDISNRRNAFFIDEDEDEDEE